MSEHDHQVALFQWAEMNIMVMPELALLFAIPNGGLRNIQVAVKLKKEGVKAGVPDVFLAVARNGYHGLFIEMKYGKNKLTENQLRWHERLGKEGYAARVCYDWEVAKNIITEYLDGLILSTKGMKK